MNDWLSNEPLGIGAAAGAVALFALLLCAAWPFRRSLPAARSAADLQLRVAARIMESVTDAVVICDANFTITHVNPGFTEITGLPAGEVLGEPVTVLCSEDNGQFERDARPALLAGGAWEGEHWKQYRDGRRHLARIRVAAVVDEVGRPTHYVATLRDVTKKKESEQQLHYLANHDALTGLMNRSALLQHLDAAIARSGRLRRQVAVVFLDILRLKQINDSFGHAFGDEVLRGVAERLVETLRFEDVVARIGGDEFVVLLERVSSRENVVKVVKKLVQAFRHELDFPDRSLTVTASIGVSFYPDDAASGLELLEHAETAMYETKKLQHVDYSFYEGAMTKSARGELKREHELRYALENNELQLHYQPIFDATSGALRGMEALLRWQNPAAGLLMPGEFIYLAERRGLINEIGAWVLETACRDAAALNSALGSDAYVSVNVSSLQVRKRGFLEVVQSALSSSGLSPEQLHIELTESLLMESSAHVLQVLSELRKLGVRLALDDFGTGYSSLGYLRRFPISKLKIDKSFVRDIPHDTGAASIVTTIIALAHAMGMDLTAEGVETRGQREFLERHGCREQQGFHYSSALNVHEVRRLFAPPSSESVLSASPPDS